MLNTVKVLFENHDYNYSTSVSHNITEEGCKGYFVGKSFDMGAYPLENMQKCIGIEFTDINKLKEGQAVLIDCHNSKLDKVEQLAGIVITTVSALDRDYRVNVLLEDGREIRESAPECVHIKNN